MDHLIDMMRYWNWDYWKFLAFLIALGAVTMALLQLILDLTPARSLFHAFLLRQWIKQRTSLYNKLLKLPRSLTETASRRVKNQIAFEVDERRAFSQLIANATGGHARALFGLAPPQLVAQINAAAQGALEDVRSNFALIAVLSQPIMSRLPDLSKVAPELGDHEQDLLALLNPPDKREPNPDQVKKYLDARNRVATRIQRNLDGLQITLASDSALINQILAIIVATGICYLIVMKTRAPEHTYLYSVLIIGVAGGYIAPILSDIVVAIRKLGRP